jgi:hypothetical protein
VQGFLFKYQADTSDRFLRDKGPYISDPDFWSNSVAVWAVCGVYFRKGLKPGDVLFFMPQKRTYPQGMSPYRFTGFLTCSKKIDGSSLRFFSRISANYAKRYRTSLAEHLALDRPATKKIRPANVVIGTASNQTSRWFGDQPIPAQPLMEETSLEEQLAALGMRNNNIPPLNEAQAVKLLRRLVSLTEVSEGMGPFPPADGTSRCTTCSHQPSAQTAGRGVGHLVRDK